MILLIALPDGIVSYLEATNIMNLDPYDNIPYATVRILLGCKSLFPIPIVEYLMQAFFISMSILLYSVRFKPLLNILYSARCVKIHLENINKQIIITDERFEFNNQRSRSSSNYGNVLDEHKSRLSSLVWPETDACGINSEQSLKRPSRTSSSTSKMIQQVRITHSTIIRTTSPPDNLPLRMTRGSSNGSLVADSLVSSDWSPRGWMTSDLSFRHDAISTGHSTATERLSLVSEKSLAKFAINSDDRRKSSVKPNVMVVEKEKRTCTIENLNHLEHHISKLSFFVGDMDRRSAEVIFSMSCLAFIQFIYGIFFLIEFSKNSPSYLEKFIAFIIPLMRLSSPFYLFTLGDQMVKEANKLLANLEIMYMQESNQTSSIYKQYDSHDMFSLDRTIRLLKSIRFDCDKIMRINLATMKKFLLYALTTIFIVIQYGKF